MSDKAKFQVERIALFSDAVFAIAATLMIIEVKPPHLHEHTSNREALIAVLKLSPMFFGVILSFIFIGLFWLRHHQLMKHVEGYTKKLIMLNFLFLLTIVFIPFSTALVFENSRSGSYVPMVVYNLNYMAAAIFNYILFAYVLNPANSIMAPDSTERIGQYRVGLLFPLAVYALVIIVSFFSVNVAPAFYGAFAFQRFFQQKPAIAARKE